MVLVNGVAADGVAATDRGLSYGDGVFRTLVARDGCPRWWRDHYRKLVHDCSALAIPCPAEATLAAEVASVAQGARERVVKVIVTRGSSERGYAPPVRIAPTRIVMAAPMPSYPPEYWLEGIRAHLCHTRLGNQPRLAGVKHLNRLENVLARSEWSDPGLAEGLVADEDGYLVGGTMTNLFVAERGAFVTPALAGCGVAGVTRGRVMEGAAVARMRCVEEPISLARLREADEIILVNSVIGAWQVRECAGRSWPRGALVARVREWLNE